MTRVLFYEYSIYLLIVSDTIHAVYVALVYFEIGNKIAAAAESPFWMNSSEGSDGWNPNKRSQFRRAKAHSRGLLRVEGGGRGGGGLAVLPTYCMMGS